jgi:hypothetical protein
MKKAFPKNPWLVLNEKKSTNLLKVIHTIGFILIIFSKLTSQYLKRPWQQTS